MKKSIVVLGATSGLAEAFIRQAAVSGYALVLQGRRHDVLAERRTQIFVEATSIESDIGEAGLMDRLWEASQAQGTPHGLISFVGVAGRVPDADWTPDTLADLFRINSATPLLLTHRWAQRMREAGLSGNAVLLSTMQAEYPFEGSLAYSLSKSGIGLGVQILAKEHGPSIRVNAIAPGVNEAGMALESIGKGKYQPYLDRQTIPRYGTANDVAQAALFLMQPELYMTGQTLLLDGGLTLRRDLPPA